LWHTGTQIERGRQGYNFLPLLHQGQNYDTTLPIGIDSGIGIGPALQRCRIYSIPEPSGYVTCLWNRIPRRRITASDATFGESAPAITASTCPDSNADSIALHAIRDASPHPQ
jgi:hypothetical protein